MATETIALSGKAGQVYTESSELLHITSWTLEYGVNVETFAARSGAGAEETQAGLESGSGTIEGMMTSSATPGSLLSTGQLVDLELWHNAAGAIKASGGARLGKFSFGANRDGTMQTWSVPFTCHKAWTLPSA